jgi:Flp pilus assembly protein TadD
MKKVLTGALAVMMILSLAACAGTSGKNKVRVKCPACGYEFDAPTE